jgi:elongation factor 1 alpha-like protein
VINIAIEVDDVPVKWAMAGTNVTVALANIDPVNLNIGSVLCYSGEAVPLAASFTARIIVFDIAVPITAGASVGSRLQERRAKSLTLHFCPGGAVQSIKRRSRYDQ